MKIRNLGRFHQKILLYNKKITDATFSNIVFISSQLGEFLWAEKFIKEYKGNLLADVRENTTTMCLAFLSF